MQPADGQHLAELRDEIRRYGCPGCHTGRRRATSVERPEVWYDTLLSEWVVALPGPGGPQLLPLRIRWFDAPLPLVQLAAVDRVNADALPEDSWA